MISRPSSLTVPSVKRRPTWRPISANASSRRAGGTANSTPASVSAPATSIGPEQRARGHVRTARDQRRAGGDGGRQQPVGRVAERGRAGAGRASPTGPEGGDQQRREQDHDEHAQVLHEGDEAVVAAEVVAIVTIPEAPPAIIPSVAVGTSSAV